MIKYSCQTKTNIISKLTSLFLGCFSDVAFAFVQCERTLRVHSHSAKASAKVEEDLVGILYLLKTAVI